MIYLAAYLYVCGATIMWWYARSLDEPKVVKLIAVLGWPVVVPAAALWG